MTTEFLRPSPPIPLQPADPFAIPPQTAEAWRTIPPTLRLPFDLARQDLDRLFVAIQKNMQAVEGLQECLNEYSNGRMESANSAIRRSREQLIEAQSEFRLFMKGVMATATTGGKIRA
jgi:hypothetical protein